MYRSFTIFRTNYNQRGNTNLPAQGRKHRTVSPRDIWATDGHRPCRRVSYHHHRAFLAAPHIIHHIVLVDDNCRLVYGTKVPMKPLIGWRWTWKSSLEFTMIWKCGALERRPFGRWLPEGVIQPLREPQTATSIALVRVIPASSCCCGGLGAPMQDGSAVGGSLSSGDWCLQWGTFVLLRW